MKKLITRLTCLGLTVATALSAAAVPANPRPNTFTQPDGSVITLSQRGDERCSFYLTTSGKIVRQAPDGWFRLVNNDGSLSQFTPNDLEMKLVDKDAFTPELAFNALMKEAENSPFAARKAAATYGMQRVIPGGKYDNADGHDIRNIPTAGNPHVLVILVDFLDKKFSYCSDPHTEMTNMMNQQGYSNFNCTGSARDFYVAQSRGIYNPTFDVYGPVQLPQNMAYYGANSGGADVRPAQMVVDACTMLDSQVDFSIYDTNGDGYVDNVYIFYAGYGENDGGGANSIWPHSWEVQRTLQCPELDGVKINHYACSNELNSPRSVTDNTKVPTGIGTFCHEFGHVLGQPDMYSVTYTDAFTPGAYSAMDHGSYNNNGRTPPNFSAYERYAMEWINPVTISDATAINMLPLGDGGNVYKICPDNSKPTEYWLFENRQKTGWDTYIPGHGMLVWHIDYDKNIWDRNVVNDTPSHQYVDLIEADGTQSTGSQTGDPFPGTSNITEYTESTSPAFRTWTNKVTPLPITAIQESKNGVISFKVKGGSNENDPLFSPAPVPMQDAVSAKSMTVKWAPVEGAQSYIVAAYKYAIDMDYGEILTEPVRGYEFTNVGSDTSLTLRNLEEATSYVVQVYACTDKNLSDAGEATFTTSNNSFTNSKPVLFVQPDDVTALMSWPAMDGASDYQLTVATRVEGEYNTVQTVPFDNKKFPIDWYFDGVFDTRADYSGENTPSLRLNYQESSILSGEYDEDIAEIDFWARVSRQNAIFTLDFYAVAPNGSLTKFATITDINGTKQGSNIKITNIPDGTRQWMAMYNYVTADLVLNIDDIEVKTRGNVTDTPVTGYNGLTLTGTNHNVTGLQRDTNYVAWLTARSASGISLKSPVVYFRTLQQSGVDTLFGTDNLTDAIPVYYDLQGRQVTNPGTGIYIVRRGNKVTKEILR